MDARLMIGSLLIAIFSFLVRNWIFFALNALFALFSLLNIVRVGKGKDGIVV